MIPFCVSISLFTNERTNGETTKKKGAAAVVVAVMLLVPFVL
jgi:hypothetical protein